MYIETERLIIRSLAVADLDDLMTIWGNDEVMRYCGGATTREREAKSLQFYIQYEMDHGFSTYAVLKKSEPHLIGVCGFNPKGDDYEGELMYHFRQDIWGNGYAKEAIGACLTHALDTLKFKTLFAGVEKPNTASVRLLEHFGFQRTSEDDTEYCYYLKL